jgi:capsular polysaccharide export protein
MKRTFLFLQGPHGPFFKMLSKSLIAQGHKVIRINFNAGDWIDFPSGIAYKHSLEMWPSWIEHFVKHNQITDILLYGDCRPLHRAAIMKLKPLNIRVHVFEEGYLRPNWITYEQGGVNGYSKIQENISSILSDDAYDQTTIATYIPIKHNMKYLLKHCIRYYLFKWLGIAFFPRYKTHRPVSSIYEALIWVKRYIALRFIKRAAIKESKRLLEQKSKFFIFIMQLTTDFQIREHSHFPSMKHALIKVIYSFLNNAPSDVKLVVKNHPLDNGQKNYGKLIKNISNELGCKDRIVYLDGGGNLPELLDNCLGAIMVNSTAGLQAIHHNKPTKILGTAIYDHPNLVNACDLDDFWNNYTPPNRKMYKRFRAYLLKNNQFNGSFYDPSGVNILIPSITKVLTS